MSDSCSIPSKFDLCQIRVESWHGFFLVLLTQIRTLCRHRMAHTTNPRTPLPRSDGLDQITSLPSVSVAKRQPSDPWWPVLATRPFNSTGKKSSFCTQKEVDRDEWVEIDVTKERETLLYRGREGGSRNARKFGDDGAAESWNLAIWGSQRLWGVGSKGKVVFLGVLALSCCFRGDLFDSFWFWEGKKEGYYSRFVGMDRRALDDIIRRLLEVRGSRPGKQVQLSEAEIRQLCVVSKDIFMQQPNLLELEAPIKICGKFLSFLWSCLSFVHGLIW